MTGDCFVFKFLRRKHLIRFQSGTSVFKFLWSSVDGAFPNFVSNVYLASFNCRGYPALFINTTKFCQAVQKNSTSFSS